MKGALVRGIDPALEGAVTDLAATNEKTLNLLVPGEFRVVLGASWPVPWACGWATR